MKISDKAKILLTDLQLQCMDSESMVLTGVAVKLIQQALDDQRKETIAEVAKAIYAMDKYEQKDSSYWINLIAWNVQNMGEEIQLPQASPE